MSGTIEVREDDDASSQSVRVLGLCQKLTSAHKPRTWLTAQYDVLKGPFRRADKVRLILLRRAILAEAWELRVVGPFTRLRSGAGEYLRAPHVAGAHLQRERLSFSEQSVLSFDEPVRVYAKDGQGFVELNEAIRSGRLTPTLEAQAAVHFLARYILDPVVGDAALRNLLLVLAPQPYVVGIDFEDNRTGGADKRALEQRAGLETCLSGGKRWSRAQWAAIERGLARRADVEPFLERVEARWGRVAAALRQSACAAECSMVAMRQRARYVRTALHELWSREEPAAAAPPSEHGAMVYSFRAARSANGHAKDVLLSAVQKYVRRNELDAALYAAVELDKFSMLPAAKALVTNSVNRLWVIAGEEVGIASPRLAVAFDAAYEQWAARRERGYADELRREALLRMVTMLVRAPKIRLISDLKAAFLTPGAMQLALNDAELRKMYPDDAGSSLESLAAAYWRRVPQEDRESAAQLVARSEPELVRRAAAGMLFAARTKCDDGFYWLGQLAQFTLGGGEAALRPATFAARANKNPMRLALHILAAAARRDGVETQRAVAVCVRRYKHFGLKLGGAPKSHRDWCVFVLWPALYVFRAVLYAIFPPASSVLPASEVVRIYARNDTKRVFDDYVFDQHTAEGRRRGRGPEHFAAEGAHVNREALALRNPRYRALYARWKRVQQMKKRKR